MRASSHSSARATRATAAPRIRGTLVRAAIETLESRRMLATSAWASPGVDGRLVYGTTVVGDRIPDLSQVGYKSGNVPLPNTTGGVTVPVKLTLNPGAPGVDMTATIQAAIDDVSNDAMDGNGFRGAVKLNAGNYPISGTLHINASGVLLMGVGDSSTTGTRLEATGTATRFLIEVDGTGSRSSSGSTYTITDSYTPVGASSFHVSSTASLSVGDDILVTRPSPDNWIHDIGMDLLDNPWTAGSKNQNWERKVTAISGNTVTIDIPLTNSLDVQYGGGTFRHYTYTGRINQVGITDLYMYSDSLGAGDLAHATGSIDMDRTIDGWMHNITSDGFAVNQIIISGGSKFCTIDDAVVQNTTVSDQAPPAGISVNGSLNLVQNVTEHGVYHAVALTSTVAGPNVIYNLLADGVGSDCGPHQRWSTGGLFDDVTIVGNDLQAFNRGNSGSGHGWAGANYVFWNCSARNLEIDNPPTAQNWAIGCIGTKTNNGTFDSLGTNVSPQSLYLKQLWDRTHQNPTIATAANATPNPRSGTTSNLSVLGGYNLGESNLTYTWSIISKPAGAADPTFSANGSNSAKNTTATFSAAGTYIFKVTISDAGGLVATSNVIVSDRPTTTLNGDQQTSNQNDVFLVNRSGNNIQIFRNASLILTQDFATSPQLAINSAGGEDSIQFDFTGGNPIPANGFVVDAGAGIGDQVSVIGSAGADAVALATGNVSINGSNFLYASAESMLLNLGAGGDTLSVNGGNSAVTTNALWLSVSGGSLTMGAASTLPDFTNLDVSSGATFDLNGQNQTVDFFSSAGTIRSNAAGTSATFSIGKNGGSGNVSGPITNGTGTVALTKLGFGTISLSGTNSYTGVTTISGGVLASGNSASLAGLTGPVWFNGGTYKVTANTVSANVANKYATTFTGATAASTGTFDVDAGVTLTIGVAGTTNAGMRTNGGGSHGGRFTKTGAGTIRILSGNPQQDDPFQLNSGTIIVEHADGLGKADAGVKLDMKAGTTLILKQDAGSNFQTPINALDANGTINIVIDRLTAGVGVTHSFNTLTSSGAFTLNLTAGSNVTSGAAGLSIGNVILSGAGTFSVANSLGVTGPVSGSFGLTKSGTGIMTLSGTSTYTGATTVSSGTLAVSGAAAIPAANAVTVNGSATYRMSGAAAAFKLASLTVNSTATARVDPDGDSTLITDALTLTSLAKLQLNDNDLVVNTGNFTTIRNQMIQAFNNGGLSGISTSSDGSQILALFDNALVGLGTWNGQPIGASAVVGKYTYFGDANMDGQVTGDDYTIIDSNLNTTPAPGLAWLSGDVNLDGIVTGDDYTTIDSNLNLGVGNPLAPASLKLRRNLSVIS